jgi:hypothetical protein
MIMHTKRMQYKTKEAEMSFKRYISIGLKKTAQKNQADRCVLTDILTGNIQIKFRRKQLGARAVKLKTYQKLTDA